MEQITANNPLIHTKYNCIFKVRNCMCSFEISNSTATVSFINLIGIPRQLKEIHV